MPSRGEDILQEDTITINFHSKNIRQTVRSKLPVSITGNPHLPRNFVWKSFQAGLNFLLAEDGITIVKSYFLS